MPTAAESAPEEGLDMHITEAEGAQTNLTFTMLPPAKRQSTSSASGGMGSHGLPTTGRPHSNRGGTAETIQRHRIITAPAFITQQRGSAGMHPHPQDPHGILPHTNSEQSLGNLVPAIISQTGTALSRVDHDYGCVGADNTPEQVLPKQYVKLFLARQKDL